MRKKAKAFAEYCKGLPRPAQCVVRFTLWLGVMPIFICFDFLRLTAIGIHDFGEWLLTIVVDEDMPWTRNWWSLRKQI